MMHFCQTCQAEVEAKNHNGRGNRCPICWGTDLTEVKAKPEPKPQPKPATRRKKAAN